MMTIIFISVSLVNAFSNKLCTEEGLGSIRNRIYNMSDLERLWNFVKTLNGSTRAVCIVR